MRNILKKTKAALFVCVCAREGVRACGVCVCVCVCVCVLECVVCAIF